MDCRSHPSPRDSWPKARFRVFQPDTSHGSGVDQTLRLYLRQRFKGIKGTFEGGGELFSSFHGAIHDHRQTTFFFYTVNGGTSCTSRADDDKSFPRNSSFFLERLRQPPPVRVIACQKPSFIYDRVDRPRRASVSITSRYSMTDVLKGMVTRLPRIFIPDCCHGLPGPSHKKRCSASIFMASSALLSTSAVKGSAAPVPTRIRFMAPAKATTEEIIFTGESVVNFIALI